MDRKERSNRRQRRDRQFRRPHFAVEPQRSCHAHDRFERQHRNQHADRSGRDDQCQPHDGRVGTEADSFAPQDDRPGRLGPRRREHRHPARGDGADGKTLSRPGRKPTVERRRAEDSQDRKSSPNPRLIPDGVEIANKPGGIEGVACDWAVVYVPNRPYAIAVMTNYNGPDSEAADDAIAKVSKLAYDYFARLSRSTGYGARVPLELLKHKQD